MATNNKTLQVIASKLGLAGEEKVIRKAAEFERLLQTKSTTGSNMTDTSKVVICLDLAACALGVEFDTKVAMKYSGLKVSTYTSCRKTLENLLEISGGQLGVSGLCIMLQCTNIQELAENILQEYQKQAKMKIDLKLPQYVCMAVHQAGRISKVKISKSKLIEKSRLKPAQFSKLETDWSKFVDEKFAAARKKRGRPHKIADAIDEPVIAEGDNGSKTESCAPPTESYEDWKRRILETAYRELGELQKQEKNKKQETENENVDEDRSLSPRRSSKTDQLMSPRKSTRQLSPRKDSSKMSTAKFSQRLSPRKNSQQLSPRKNSHSLSSDTQHRSSMKVVLHIPAKKNNVQLLSPRISQHLSPSKVNHNLSPRKDGSFVSPMQEDVSSRRSPRKTPQKYSPYKSPSGKSGVRLLFPKNL